MPEELAQVKLITFAVLRTLRETFALGMLGYKYGEIPSSCVPGQKITSEIHCHHKKPKGIEGSDKYENLVLVLAPVHELIHAVDEETIRSYLSALKLDASQLAKLNKLRILANRKPIDSKNLNLKNSHNGMTKETKKTV